MRWIYDVRLYRHDALGILFPAAVAPAPWCTYDHVAEMSAERLEAFMDETASAFLDAASRN